MVEGEREKGHKRAFGTLFGKPPPSFGPSFLPPFGPLDLGHSLAVKRGLHFLPVLLGAYLLDKLGMLHTSTYPYYVKQ